MGKREQHKGWATQNELQFLNNIGSHATQSVRVQARSKKELLESYIRAARGRKVWGAVNKKTVIKRAKEMLAAEG